MAAPPLLRQKGNRRNIDASVTLVVETGQILALAQVQLLGFPILNQLCAISRYLEARRINMFVLMTLSNVLNIWHFLSVYISNINLCK